MYSSLERPDTAQYRDERLQALKLVRAVVEASAGDVPRSIMQSLVALAEALDDPLQRQCLRALCEVALRRPAIVAASNGVRTIINAIVEPRLASEQPALVAALSYLLDGPDTRQYVRTNDVGVILAPLCSTYRGKDALSDEELAVWRAVSTSIFYFIFKIHKNELFFILFLFFFAQFIVCACYCVDVAYVGRIDWYGKRTSGFESVGECIVVADRRAASRAARRAVRHV